MSPIDQEPTAPGGLAADEVAPTDGASVDAVLEADGLTDGEPDDDPAPLAPEPTGFTATTADELPVYLTVGHEHVFGIVTNPVGPAARA